MDSELDLLTDILSTLQGIYSVQLFFVSVLAGLIVLIILYKTFKFFFF